MENILITIYFKENVTSPTDPGVVTFTMQGANVDEVAQTILNVKGKHAINLGNGYRIINFDNMCWVDIQSETEYIKANQGIL